MDKQQAAEITRKRLKRWAKLMAPHCLTPAILIGVGHGDNLGEIHVVTVTGLEDEALLGLLVAAADRISRGRKYG